MTTQEVVDLAFTRNMSAEHFDDSDIIIARANYVLRFDESLEDSDSYVKAVIAHGVAVDCWERIASEITDRGMVQAAMQGSMTLQPDRSQQLKQEYRRKLNHLINLMLKDSGHDELDVDPVMVVANENTGI